MRSQHDININNGELLWTKHDGSRVCPVDKSAMIEIETWTAKGNVIASANEVNWSVVKYYRIVNEINSVDIERKRIVDKLVPPTKDYKVTYSGQEQRANGYQDASQKALDLYKQGHEPKIEIQYSKPLNGTT